MALIDVDDLRDRMMDYSGTAAANGFPGAALDLVDIEDMDGEELCEAAEELGVDLEDFVVED